MTREDWKSLHWGELVTLEYGRALRNTPESGPVPVYGTNGQIGWTDRPLCGHPSVIVGRKGAYRGIHYAAVPFFVIDTAFYLEPRGDISVDMRWAYYQLLMQDINGLDTGSGHPIHDEASLLCDAGPGPAARGSSPNRRIAGSVGRQD